MTRIPQHLVFPLHCPERGQLLLLRGGGGDHPKREEATDSAEIKIKEEKDANESNRIEIPTALEAHKYQLRSKRQPRYKCGTCGLRDCVCLLTVNENWGLPLEPGEFLRKEEKRKGWFTATPSEPRRRTLL